MTRAELIAALEAATGPSRELDAEIAALMGLAVEVQQDEMLDVLWKHPNGKVRCDPPRFTASLDAAMTLMQEGTAIERLSWWPRCAPGLMASVDLLATDENGFGIPSRRVRNVQAANPALAICIAALKARGE